MLGFWVQGLRVQGSAFRVKGSGFGVAGGEIWIWYGAEGDCIGAHRDL